MTDETKRGHGGARNGAGRHPVMPAGEYVNTRIPAGVKAELAEIGRGNISAGVRRAILAYIKLDAWAQELYGTSAADMIDELVSGRHSIVRTS